jgi:hypothetical protein
LTEKKQEAYENTQHVRSKGESQEKFFAMDEHIRQKDRELATIESKFAKVI